MVKFGFNTEPKDGWPPFEFEHIWLEEIRPGKYRVTNTPFYLRGMCYGDEIEIESEDGAYVSSWNVLQESKYSTVWIMELRANCFKKHIKRIREKGSFVENGVPTGYYSITIPDRSALEDFESAIRQDLQKGFLSVSYATLRAVD